MVASQGMSGDRRSGGIGADQFVPPFVVRRCMPLSAVSTIRFSSRGSAATSASEDDNPAGVISCHAPPRYAQTFLDVQHITRPLAVRAASRSRAWAPGPFPDTVEMSDQPLPPLVLQKTPPPPTSLPDRNV